MLKNKINQAGETIVEVLICTAILSLGFTSAFLISNQSTVTTRQNEAKYQAQLYAQQQINLLKNYVNTSNGVRSRVAPFYLSVTGGAIVMNESAPVLIATNGGTRGLYYCVDVSNLGRYDNNGNPGATGGRGINYFKITVSWDTNPARPCNWALPNHALGTISEYYAA
jgi:type II secretory pathway pseudopilin PulG